ncbi:unnamed protein product [Effrenium voratum]|nr:unnamed protein product [Effrenium voratum]
MGVMEAARRAAAELAELQGQKEALALRAMQEQARKTFKELLKHSCRGSGLERCRALDLLAELSSDPEAASLVASCGLWDDALAENLRFPEPCEQAAAQSVLGLAWHVAGHVPESPTLQNHVPALIDLACDEGPQQPFRNLQILATQVLVQLCFGAASRRRVGNSLRMDKVKAMLTVAFFPAPEGSGLVPHHVFVVCLLLASLCDLAVPEEGGLFGQLGLESGAFGRVGFLPCLAPALAAAVRREDWPPESDVHWPAWKLTQVIERLSRHGFAHELRMCITPLTGLVVNPGDGGSRGARLAAEAMRNISCAAALDADQLRLDAQCAAEPEALRAALEALVHETPAAHDLLEVYMEGRDPLPLWPEGP